MDELGLFTAALGLSGPWRVTRSEQNQDNHHRLPHCRQTPTTHPHPSGTRLHALTLSNPLKTAKNPLMTEDHRRPLGLIISRKAPICPYTLRNGKPRDMLNWRTPIEVFEELIDEHCVVPPTPPPAGCPARPWTGCIRG